MYFPCIKITALLLLAPLAFAVKNFINLSRKSSIASSAISNLLLFPSKSSPCFSEMVAKNKSKNKSKSVDEEAALKVIKNTEFVAMRKMQKQLSKPSTSDADLDLLVAHGLLQTTREYDKTLYPSSLNKRTRICARGLQQGKCSVLSTTQIRDPPTFCSKW